MAQLTLNPADVANAQLGINLPLLYGHVRGVGNEILNHTIPAGQTFGSYRVVIRMCGEGECDGIDALFINSVPANQNDTTLVHFHPGSDGVLGHGLTPDSNGGDQLVDSFWLFLPSNFIPTTFSRKCYLMFFVPPDPSAPTADLDIRFDLRGCKLRQFDASGNQTAYSFSTNGAWQCLDAILRSIIKPDWLTASAAAAGGDLTADEKARFDFPSIVDAAAWCDQALANGQKRFESSLAIVQSTSLNDVLTQLQNMSQLYVLEDSGKIYIRADKPRASTFLMTSDHVVAGKVSLDKIYLRGKNNRLVGSYNDLNAQDIADIDTPTNLGLVRSGIGTVTVKTTTSHPYTVGQNVQVCQPTDGSVQDGGFDGTFAVATVPSANQYTYAQNGNANWLEWSEQFDQDAWFKQTNITVTANNQTDPLGGNTADTISSGVTSGQGVLQFSILPIQSGLQFTFSVWLKAASNITVTLRLNRANASIGVDNEDTNVNVTSSWQRFTATHSGTYTGAGAAAVTIILPTSSSVFAWGAQMEDGAAATSYRQSTTMNQLLWTEQMDNAAWTKGSHITVTANSTTDPNGGNTADTVAVSTAPDSISQTGPQPAVSGQRWTFSVSLKAPVNTSVTLIIKRAGGADSESTTITVTSAWQRFTLTHSGTWTGNTNVTAVIQLNTSSTSVFVWGAQLEYGPAANTYISQTSVINLPGVLSGNGYTGTPESRFAVRAPVVDHEAHQNATGQRGINLSPIARVSPINLNFGNNTDERVRRAMNFMKVRQLGPDVTPYVAPWAGTITCYMDAVDPSGRSLIAQIDGDILSLDSSVSEEYQGDYEITQSLFNIPAVNSSASASDSSQSSDGPTIELTLLQYMPLAFSDASLNPQPVRASITKGLAPIAAVGTDGRQRLAGTFKNNPTNVAGVLTGGNPLTQNGTSTTILIASFTMQFGDGQLSYNSGSVNPGSFGTWFLYLRDPLFAGGTVTFLATSSKSVLTSFNDVVWIGQITTSGAGGGVGTGGGGGACFSGNTLVKTPSGPVPFDQLTEQCEIITPFGVRRAHLKRSHFEGFMRHMGCGELVTPSHLICLRDRSYTPAREIWSEEIWYSGDVFTLHIETERDEERCFVLDNGETAHNFSNI